MARGPGTVDLERSQLARELERRPLVGREPELAALRDALRRAAANAAVVVAVLGEPGIGKSRLLEELRAEADASGWLTLVGRAGEFEQDEPFGVFAQALDDYAGAVEGRLARQLGRELLGELAPVLPALAAAGYEPSSSLGGERFRSHRAVRSLLETLAVDRPVLLVLDDMHWADEASVELLGALLRREPRGRVLIATGLRPRQASRRLTEALADGVVRVEPGTLEPEAARALLPSSLDEDTAQRLCHESGGVPFYLEELARARGREGAASNATPGVGTPAAVARALAGDIAALDDGERQLLRGAAVAGDPFEVAIAAAAAGVDETRALPLFDALVVSDLVRETGMPRRLRFRHPIVRRAVYESTGPGWRVAAHARAARALEAAGASALERAHHVAAAASPGDEAAAALLAEAGRAAAARAPAVAAHWLGEALRLLPDGDPGTRLLLTGERARALVSAGRLHPGLDALLDALALVPPGAPALRVRLSAACASVEGFLGRHRQAYSRLVAALGALPDARSLEAAVLHAELAMAALWANDLERVTEHAQLAHLLAGDAGDDLLAAATGAIAASAEHGQGRLETACTALDSAGALLDSSDDTALAGRVDAAAILGHTAFLMERFPDALRWSERGLAVCRRTGQGHVLVPLMTAQAFSLGLLGRLSVANEVVDETVEAARLGAGPFALAWALRLRCWISGLIGELRDAQRAGEEAIALLRALDPSQTGAGAAWMMGETLVQAGELRRARAIVLELGGGPDLARNNPAARCAGYEVLTMAAAAVGDTEQAAQWATRAEDSARGLGDGMLAAIALRAKSRALLAAEDHAAAAIAAREAAVCAARPGARIEAARGRLLAGQALSQAGQHQAAIAELEHAQAELDACGARRLRDEAAQELRRLGHRVTRTAGTVAPQQSPGPLSARELEIAELVAAGYQNKQIAASLHISLNTVQTHVKRILAKLDAPNRAAVASKLARDWP